MLHDTSSESMDKALVVSWIYVISVPSTIITVGASQFTSALYRQLSRLLDSTHIHTIAYHTAANGLISWNASQSFYLLHSEMILDSKEKDDINPLSYAACLKGHFRYIRLITARLNDRSAQIHMSLSTCPLVFVRVDTSYLSFSTGRICTVTNYRDLANKEAVEFEAP
ncbi:hypothetical protein ACTXT7_010576 [Hymenolepis weldensis]